MYGKETQSVTPYGFKLISPSYAANRQMLNGDFEKDEVEVIKKHLSSDSLFVDVGANIGFYTLLALSSGCSVFAIEPKPSNAKILVKNLVINNFTNGQCQFYPVGVGEYPGITPLYGATGTAASLLKGWAGHSDKIKEHIPVTALDYLLSHVGSDKKIMVKIDVEGFECSVMKGALSTLNRKNVIWLVEICFDEYFRGGEVNPHFVEIFDLFMSRKYRAFTADKDFNEVTLAEVRSWVAARRRPGAFINYLFLR